ncbi:MAG: hypothetical protein ABI639_13475 [Thermoanaerobaculia bacterium]
MHRRALIVILTAAALVTVAVALPRLLADRSRDWSTDSPAARTAFQAGLDARMRFYLADAATSFRRAVELDPDFAAAKVQLLDLTHDSEEHQSLLAQIAGIDVSRLNERECFLVELARAKRDHQAEITGRFLKSHPRDSWGLFIAAGQAWDHEEWETAGALYRRLLEVDPNWVLARNNLGYMSMAQARFAEAEEQFRTYAYVAPDQANPHDSLGELLSLLGRYDEARSELEQALAIRPDFCASYEHLIGIAIFEGKPEAIEPIAARAETHCSPAMAAALRCEGKYFAAYVAKDFTAPWREGFASCVGKPGDRGVLFYRMALMAGEMKEVDAEEAALAKAVEDSRTAGYGRGKGRMIEAQSFHVRGLRKLYEGDPAAAAALFRSADERASFWSAGEGRLKLFNELNLALALERSGDENDATAERARVKAINPAFAAIFPKIAERSPGGSRM